MLLNSTTRWPPVILLFAPLQMHKSFMSSLSAIGFSIRTKVPSMRSTITNWFVLKLTYMLITKTYSRSQIWKRNDRCINIKWILYSYFVKAAVNLLSAVITIPIIIPSDLGSMSRQISLVDMSNDTNLNEDNWWSYFNIVFWEKLWFIILLLSNWIENIHLLVWDGNNVAFIRANTAAEDSKTVTFQRIL